MRHRDRAPVALLAACLVLVGLPGLAAAQIACPRPAGERFLAGTPRVDTQHIFCGEVDDGRAKGFHSRPGGQNPATVSGTPVPQPLAGKPGLYILRNFTITERGEAGRKAISTMFPDSCDAAAVIAALRHAYTHGQVNGGQFDGPSGPGCTLANGQQFSIRGFTAGTGSNFHIRTGFPN